MPGKRRHEDVSLSDRKRQRLTRADAATISANIEESSSRCGVIQFKEAWALLRKEGATRVGVEKVGSSSIELCGGGYGHSGPGVTGNMNDTIDGLLGMGFDTAHPITPASSGEAERRHIDCSTQEGTTGNRTPPVLLQDVYLDQLKNNPAWKRLVQPDELAVDDPLNLETAEICEEYEFEADPASSLQEMEAIRNMRFDPEGQIDGPQNLFEHHDGSTVTFVCPEFRHLFEHSASSAFFAYLPLYFWRQVLYQTNEYAVVKGIQITQPFTLRELMPEDLIFGGRTTALDDIMSLNRFKLLRRCLSFNVSPTTLDIDAAARIRSLLNMLKVTGNKYVVVGRDVALDEASVACRSRQGRHLVVFNPMKPTGKYHFRLYDVCCSSTWIVLNFRLHCNRSGIADRLGGVVSVQEAQGLAQELGSVSKIRQLVLEVVRPLFGSNRVVNMDNYYTSVQLLQELRLKGLYGRGTIRANSKHFPGHTILDKDLDSCVRGDLRNIARANAYSTRRLVSRDSKTRDPHRSFITELVGELINGKWAEAPGEGRMLYTSGESRAEDPDGEAFAGTVRSDRNEGTPVIPCASIGSKQTHAKQNRKKRRCIVCRWEGRYPTEVTTYCLTHDVCLCRVVHAQAGSPWICPETAWTCWEKYHRYYWEKNLFSYKGNINRGSELAKLRLETTANITSVSVPDTSEVEHR
ncbi:hypothetical protein ON010_g9452 [Phytophthora cinnamomi]|nr:hypothetical protein ON010_g9452 [Phytophthora cinnamomi]